ncbi:MAG: UDP-N-acetylmuramate:L-alanyl-gamma-D-glutamyl-meso-diaminopimelate ligase [Cellvibrionaceae bacterium]|nr:UDP-N-acetylmuramate:L-alanyl-gamma-D-glutamyl-meso-diaminopimelate ligase [Cellvibrionaceae bacterium]
MGSLAQLAVALGYRVTGCDDKVYPPMSTQLAQAGIAIMRGYDDQQLDLQPDCFVVGNAVGRDNPLVEAILNRGLAMVSGPQWLHQALLQDKWVLAVSGTHGKTSTSSMLAWILECAGMAPGFLIGGVPTNFSVSARLGDTPFFVLEADEYDTAFFDKRSKFIHYHPRTLIINNLEFDHADIFADLAAIQTQFHHLLRTVPQWGEIIYPAGQRAIDEVLSQGCWTPLKTLSPMPSDSGWSSERLAADGSAFAVYLDGRRQARVQWQQLGDHNIANGLAAIAAARHVGVPADVAAAALATFKGVKRRLECVAAMQGVKLYDDFAHHPTAIRTTLSGLRQHVGNERIIAVIEPRSNTMRLGVHGPVLAAACESADAVLWYSPGDLCWDLDAMLDQHPSHKVFTALSTLIEAVVSMARAPAHIVIMSNGGFDGIHEKLITRLSAQ